MLVERCREADLPEVFDLYRRTLRFPPPETLERYWTWKLLGNPSHHGDAPCWVAREGHTLVGSMIEIPVSLQVHGHAIAAAWAADFMIDPRFQGRGLGKALFDHYRRSNTVALSMGNAPTSATSRVAQAVGFVASPPLRYAFKLLSTKLVTRRLRLGRIAGPLIDRLSRRPLRRLGHLSGRATGSVRIEEIAAFGPPFDALWATVAGENAVSVHRDHATMNWRYRDNPFQRYRTLGAWSGSVLAGCLVFKIVHHDAFTYATIAELIVPAGAEEVLETLLARAFEEFEREDVDIVKTLASPPHLVRVLRRAGFHALGEGCAFVISVAPSLHATFAGHLEPQTWYLTKGDSDLDMVPDFMSYLPSRPS